MVAAARQPRAATGAVMRLAFVSAFVALFLISAGASVAMDKENTLYIQLKDGRVVVEMRPDLAPKHVAQIKKLAREGKYDGVLFHRVIDGFMAQTGDPDGTGTGGMGYTFPDEIHPDLQFDRPYLLGMANTGRPVTNGSQFFITFGATTWLNGKHTIFGTVVDEDSKRVVDAIGAAKTGPGDRPIEDIAIQRV